MPEAVLWGGAIRIRVGLGPIANISRATEAAIVLGHGWPGANTAAFRAARTACSQVGLSPGVARIAFETAAREAGLLVEG